MPLILLGSSLNAQTEVTDQVRVVRDLEYSRPDGNPLLLDLYLPATKATVPPPIVLWVHGGGWKAGSKEKCPAVWLVEHGFAVASINYRLIPEHIWPAQLDDCRAAVRWLKTPVNGHQFGFNGERLAAWGASAGGHLVALLGTMPTAPEESVEAVIDWFGPTDLLTMPPNVLSEGRTREDLAKANGAILLGGIVMDQPELAKQASALHQVSAESAPFLIMHGDEDPMVPLEQSRQLHASLQEHGVESTLITLSGAKHGGREFNTEATRTHILSFLRIHLMPPKKRPRPSGQ